MSKQTTNTQFAGFTPGKWTADERINSTKIVDTNGITIASIYTEANSKANAALIAAAPDLLRENQELREALQHCLSFLADLNGSEWIKGDDIGALDMKQRAKGLQRLTYNTIHIGGEQKEKYDTGK